MSGGGGKYGASVPSFQNVNLGPGMASTGSAIANRYSQLGLGDSTMETQDENANVMAWDTQQAQLNNQLAQQSFEDQLQSQSSSAGSGFGAGLKSVGL